MPSLPVDNQSLTSKEDAYRRYFGALKKASPRRPRVLLCEALLKVCLIALAVSIPNYTILYVYYQHRDFYLKHKLYYFYNFANMIITFIWCLSVIYVIFEYKYANFKIMTVNAFIVSSLSFAVSAGLSYLYQEKGKGTIDIDTAIWERDDWRFDVMYFIIFRFPLTLYFSIFIMYLSQYCCNNPCTFLVTSRFDAVRINAAYKENLITVSNGGSSRTEVEVFELSRTTGTIYNSDAYDYDDDDMNLSLSQSRDYNRDYDRAQKRNSSDITVTYPELEQAARTVVQIYMALYCFVFCVLLLLWFVILTVNPKQYDDFGVIFYSMLVVIYFASKWTLKRSARKIDTAIIVPNFSFEIITEILMSSFYWCNVRMFTLRYGFDVDGDGDALWSFPIIGFIHISMQIFQDSIRMSSAYFNWTGNMGLQREKKSNITQWKVRGAIDTCIRFIISVYSILFITIRYVSQSYDMYDIIYQRDLWYSLIFNYVIFMIEIVYFSCILFRPGCAGKISYQQQINMAEPLMRMYNTNSKLFLGVFCGTMVMASLLVL